jgi:hypothetical protein
MFGEGEIKFLLQTGEKFHPGQAVKAQFTVQRAVQGNRLGEAYVRMQLLHELADELQ